MAPKECAPPATLGASVTGLLGNHGARVPIACAVTDVINGRTTFDGIVQKDIAVLRKWADRDQDRTRLYGAEIRVDVP